MLTQPEIIEAIPIIISLIVIEGLLSVDNALAIAAMASHLPGKEIARYSLSADPSYAGRATLVFGEVYRKDSGWKFRAIGEAHPFDSFVPLLKQHIHTN